MNQLGTLRSQKTIQKNYILETIIRLLVIALSSSVISPITHLPVNHQITMALAFATTLSRALTSVTQRVARTSRRPCRWQSSAATPQAARAKIASETVMIFSTTYCPYCARVKDLFDDLEVPYTNWDMDQMPEGPELRRFLYEETGQNSVPNVFVNGKHVGGCDGKFPRLLSRARLVRDECVVADLVACFHCLAIPSLRRYRRAPLRRKPPQDGRRDNIIPNTHTPLAPKPLPHYNINAPCRNSERHNSKP